MDRAEHSDDDGYGFAADPPLGVPYNPADLERDYESAPRYGGWTRDDDGDDDEEGEEEEMEVLEGYEVHARGGPRTRSGPSNEGLDSPSVQDAGGAILRPKRAPHFTVPFDEHTMHLMFGEDGDEPEATFCKVGDLRRGMFVQVALDKERRLAFTAMVQSTWKSKTLRNAEGAPLPYARVLFLEDGMYMDIHDGDDRGLMKPFLLRKLSDEEVEQLNTIDMHKIFHIARANATEFLGVTYRKEKGMYESRQCASKDVASRHHGFHETVHLAALAYAEHAGPPSKEHNERELRYFKEGRTYRPRGGDVKKKKQEKAQKKSGKLTEEKRLVRNQRERERYAASKAKGKAAKGKGKPEGSKPSDTPIKKRQVTFSETGASKRKDWWNSSGASFPAMVAAIRKQLELDEELTVMGTIKQAREMLGLNALGDLPQQARAALDMLG